MMSQHSNSLATATAAIVHVAQRKSIEAVHQNGRHFHGKKMHANTLLLRTEKDEEEGVSIGYREYMGELSINCQHSNNSQGFLVSMMLYQGQN